MRTGLVIVLTASLAVSAAAGDVTFTQKPTVEQAGGGAAVTFAVSAPTDVEVAVLNAGGATVRHLAAGVLGGKKPPPEPLKPGLKQTIAWDGKDDLGQEAKGGPFKVRVRIGMLVSFGRMIGGSPYTGNVVSMPYRAPVNGLAVDGEGNLYVKIMSDIHSHGNSGLWPWHVRLFDRKGDYVRTILPYPPSTDPDRATGMTLLTAPDGAFTPANQNSLYPVLYNFGSEVVHRIVDGQLVFVHTEARQLHLFKLDGSNAVKTIAMWPKTKKVPIARWLDVQVAFSPDGRYVYYSNAAAVPYDPKSPAAFNPKWPNGRVYRQDLSKPGADPEPFFDIALPEWSDTDKKKRYWLPNAWNHKTAAAGIDTDEKGNLYLCDLVNGQVIEIGADGKQVSAVKVPLAQKVMVSRKTGALYVIGKQFVGTYGGEKPGTLYKITGRGETAKVVTTLALRGRVGCAYTLDESGDVPVIWLAGSGNLLRVEDRGSEFVVAADRLLNRDKDAIRFIGYMDVDAGADLVYVTASGSRVWRYDGETGKGGPTKLKAVDLAVGRDGMVYTWGVAGGYHGPIGRFTRDLKPAPLASGKHTYGNLSGRAGRGSSVCGMDVDARGRVYAVNGSNLCHLRVYGETGALVDYPTRIKTKKAEIPVLIDQVSGYGGSPRVDLAGNAYIVQPGLPKGVKPPKGWEKDAAYRATAASVLKFGPKGGRRLTPLNSGGRGGNMHGYEGLLAVYPDAGPTSGWRCDGSCACVHLRFEVDDYGRLYIPNAITFRVSVRDNAGNEIAAFGHYGNLDCRGPKSAEPTPAIPLGWPLAVGASDRYIYVGDVLNHRVVRVDKQFAAEETVALN